MSRPKHSSRLFSSPCSRPMWWTAVCLPHALSEGARVHRRSDMANLILRPSRMRKCRRRRRRRRRRRSKHGPTQSWRAPATARASSADALWAGAPSEPAPQRMYREKEPDYISKVSRALTSQWHRHNSSFSPAMLCLLCSTAPSPSYTVGLPETPVAILPWAVSPPFFSLLMLLLLVVVLTPPARAAVLHGRPGAHRPAPINCRPVP